MPGTASELENLRSALAAAEERAAAAEAHLAQVRAAVSTSGAKRLRHLFDPAWYAAANPDVPRATAPALWHWLRHGRREGRDPTPAARALSQAAGPAQASARRALASEIRVAARFAAHCARVAPAIPTTSPPSDGVLTVVMPVRDAAGMMPVAIASALAQTRRPRLSIVDDGSCDGSPDVAARFAAAVPDLDLVILPASLGAGAARNVGLASVTTPYVAFLDPDDLYAAPDALAVLVEAAERHGADAAFGRQLEWPAGAMPQGKPPLENPWTGGPVAAATSRALWLPAHHHRFVFRSDFLRRHGIGYSNHRRGQDFVFLARVLAAAPRLVAVDRAVHLHRLRATPWQPTPEQAQDMIAALAEAAGTLADAGLAAAAWTTLRLRAGAVLRAMHQLRAAPELPELVGAFAGLATVAERCAVAYDPLDRAYPTGPDSFAVLAALNMPTDRLMALLVAHETFPAPIHHQTPGVPFERFEALWRSP